MDSKTRERIEKLKSSCNLTKQDIRKLRRWHGDKPINLTHIHKTGWAFSIPSSRAIELGITYALRKYPQYKPQDVTLSRLQKALTVAYAYHFKGIIEGGPQLETYCMYLLYPTKEQYKYRDRKKHRLQMAKDMLHSTFMYRNKSYTLHKLLTALGHKTFVSLGDKLTAAKHYGVAKESSTTKSTAKAKDNPDGKSTYQLEWEAKYLKQ